MICIPQRGKVWQKKSGETDHDVVFRDTVFLRKGFLKECTGQVILVKPAGTVVAAAAALAAGSQLAAAGAGRVHLPARMTAQVVAMKMTEIFLALMEPSGNRRTWEKNAGYLLSVSQPVATERGHRLCNRVVNAFPILYAR